MERYEYKTYYPNSNLYPSHQGGGFQYSPQPSGRPSALIWAFVLGLISSIPQAIWGIVLAFGITAAFGFLGDLLNIGGLGSIGALIGILILVISSLMLILWILTFNGSNGARITLLILLWIDLIPKMITMVFTIPAILELVEAILLMNNNVKMYCLSRPRPAYAENRYAQNDRRIGEYSGREYNPNYSPSHLPVSNAMLIVERGAIAGKEFSLAPSGHHIIGRAGNIRVPTSDRKASRTHAQINFENGKYVIYDLTSTNHTYVNSQMVQRKVLENGDFIKIGNTYFIFKK